MALSFQKKILKSKKITIILFLDIKKVLDYIFRI